MKYLRQLPLMLLPIMSLLPTACSDDNTSQEPDKPEIPGKPETPGNPDSEPIAGCALWENYLAAHTTGKEATLLDFSYAGYEYGEREIPDVDYPVFLVDDYGAVANDNKSDRAALEAAIAAATKAGDKAIIRFSAGRYNLRSADDPNKSITISGDNIILQGAGSGEGGTEIFMEYPNTLTQANALWSAPELIRFTYMGANTDNQLLLTKVTGNAARGSHQLEVASTSGLYIGQRLLLKGSSKSTEAIAQEVTPYEVETSEWKTFINEGVQVNEYLTIERIEGNTLKFKEPLMHCVDAAWGWTLHRYQHHVGCGIEDIAFRGNFQEPYIHHEPSGIHDSGYKMIAFHRQANGWIRRCRFIDVIEAASVMLSTHVSVLDCSIEGHKGHAAIRSEASSHVLLAYINDQAGQEHSTGVSKTSIGTVIWECTTAGTSTFESHSSQPRATLIDDCSGGFLPNHAGGDVTFGPNHLADLVLWNYTETGSSGGEFNLWTRNNRFLKPIIAGFQGATTFKPEQVTADLSHGTKVGPLSLYKAQLQTRLRQLPSWISNHSSKQNESYK